MATIEDLQTSIAGLTTTVEAIDSKLDEVAAYVATLKAGVVSQEQLDALVALVDSAKEKASAVLAEADALDEE